MNKLSDLLTKTLFYNTFIHIFAKTNIKIMRKFILIIAALAIIPTLFISSCKKDKDETPITNTTTYNISVSGTVVGTDMAPLQGVDVKIGSTTKTTQGDGTFFFSNISVPKSRFVVEFSKLGYFTLSRSAVPVSGSAFDIEVGLISLNDPSYSASTMFSPTSAYTFTMTNSGCEINFPANAFVVPTGYTGNIHVNAAYIAPSMQNYPMFVFGGDIFGKDSLGNEVTLNPYAGLNVVVTDDNNLPLQLDAANNKKAQLSLDIPLALRTSAPAQIELMEYNPVDGISYATGSATRSGDKYMGQVGHFSFWSCQKTHIGKATITGSVTDANGKPVAGVRIHFGKAIGAPSAIAITDADGNYSKIIPAGVDGVVGIFPTYYGTLVPTVSIPILNDGDNYTANITIPTVIRKVTGRLVKCSNAPIKGGKVVLTWYSSTTGSYVHSGCFSKPDGSFELAMELSAYSGNIRAWGNNMDTTKFISVSTMDTVYNAGDIILCPPIQTGPTQFTLKGGQFPVDSIFTLTMMKEGYLIHDSTGAPKHIYISAEESSIGTLTIEVNGIGTGIYTVGVKSPTLVSMYLWGASPMFQDQLSTGTVKVTRFDTVGGLIEGTFSGTTTTGVLVKNGVFSVIRVADQYN